MGNYSYHHTVDTTIHLVHCSIEEASIMKGMAVAGPRNDGVSKQPSGWLPTIHTDVIRKVALCSSFIVIITIYLLQSKTPITSTATISTMAVNKISTKRLNVITWNIAAVNNNPFEYWITNNDPSYNRIMTNVSTFIDNPGSYDIPVEKIFTEEMYSELEESMIAANWTGIAATRNLWNTDYKKRKIISQFLRDAELGKKRLVSMPDRVTNTINTANEGVVMRPTVVNCYDTADLSTMTKWWVEWKKFIFEREVVVNKHGVKTKIKVSDMFSKIRKSKYPSITTAEEEISIPLQALCAAIFDAILVNMMNTIDNQEWQPLREDMCNKLNRKKTDRITEILQTSYSTADIQFLQEVASSFGDAIKKKPLISIFDVYYPASMDGDRDQNSFILLKKGKFKDVKEVTSIVFNYLNHSKPAPVSNGDLLVLTALDIVDNARYILASFHGDTNGLATIPIVNAIREYSLTKPNYKLLFGLDANTYYKPESDQQGVIEFAEFYTSKKLNSCYGPTPNPLNFTTFHARTHLQPQLNKAVRFDEKDKKGDKNPKDFILFFASDFNVLSTSKDNTGERKYVENMVFPTLSFPSDHGVTSTILIEKYKIHIAHPVKKEIKKNNNSHSIIENITDMIKKKNDSVTPSITANKTINHYF